MKIRSRVGIVTLVIGGAVCLAYSPLLGVEYSDGTGWDLQFHPLS